MDRIQPYTNPIIPGFHPDPSICHAHNVYWIAVSSFEYFPAIPIFKSHDLVNWKQVGHALDRNSQIDLGKTPSSQGIFAPTLRFHEGRFYLACTDVGGIGNFILTSDNPEEQWSDPIRIKDGPGFTWFDPSLLFDVDGKVIYTRRQDFHIVQAEIDVANGQLLTPLRRIHSTFTSDDIEGPHLYHIGDWYYLLCAEGGTAWGHAISIGRSRSPWGPFEHCPNNPILTHRHLVNHTIRYTGHGDLIQSPEGSWWLVFLGTRHQQENGSGFHHLGRETFLAPVSWEDDWPVVNCNERIEYVMRGPLPKSRPFPKRPVRDAFDAGALDLSWCFRRQIPSEQFITLTSAQGLQIKGQSGSLDDSAPVSMVCQRLQNPIFRIRTEIHFRPRQSGEEAGLCLFMSEDFHAGLALICVDGQVCLRVSQRASNLQVVLFDAPVTGGKFILGVEGDWDKFTFFHEAPGKGTSITATIDRRLLCTEVATGWVGLMVGLYATGNGRQSTAPAHFTWFEHQQSPFPPERSDR